jgi:SAM-dependent methyltransferase
MDRTALALGTAVGVAPPEPRTGAERAAAWLVGDTLSCVLHLGDAAMAYVLADQGHEVIVAGDDVTTSRHREISYVRTRGERLPFGPESFDVVVAPQVRDSATALAEYARVLRPGGLLSTMTRTYDESIPWMRRLHAVVGRRPEATPSADTLTASGLFAEPEVDEFGTWEELDLAGALRFAADVKGPTAGDEIYPAVRELFTSYASQSGTLRMRHQTHCLRARVNRENLLEEPNPETTLLDFA